MLPLRSDLEAGASARAALPGRMLGLLALATVLLHGLMSGGEQLSRLMRARTGRVAPTRDTRSAVSELQRVGREDMSKEAAASLIEKSVHRAFGSLEDDGSERARAVRELLEQVHQVRYAPQLGDYSERLRELATRAGEVVRRWS